MAALSTDLVFADWRGGMDDWRGEESPLMVLSRCQSSDSCLLPDTVEDSEADGTLPEKTTQAIRLGGGRLGELSMLEFSVVGNDFQNPGECWKRMSFFPS